MYNKEEGMVFKAVVGHRIEVVWTVSCCNRSIQEMTIQLLFGMFFKVLSNKGSSYSSTNLARVSRYIIVGLLGVVNGFLLVVNALLLLI
jgi:hypothetical protein